MITARTEWMTPAEAETATKEVGGFVVRAIQDLPTGLSEAEANETAAGMVAAGFANVAIFRLHSIVTKDKGI